jgi:hypothetical protein
MPESSCSTAEKKPASSQKCTKEACPHEIPVRVITSSLYFVWNVFQNASDLNRQPYNRKVQSDQQYLECGGFVSHNMLRMQSNNLLMMNGLTVYNIIWCLANLSRCFEVTVAFSTATLYCHLWNWYLFWCQSYTVLKEFYALFYKWMTASVV